MANLVDACGLKDAVLLPIKHAQYLDVLSGCCSLQVLLLALLVVLLGQTDVDSPLELELRPDLRVGDALLPKPCLDCRLVWWVLVIFACI